MNDLPDTHQNGQPGQSEPPLPEPGDTPCPESTEELQQKLLRLRADFDNYRRRVLESRTSAADDAKREFMAAFLPVYDALLLALDKAHRSPELDPYLAGFDMIRQQFETFCEQQGFKEIAAEPGMPFDPHVHEATATTPPDEDSSSGTIAQEIRKGFAYGDVLVRPTRVVVYE
jgi:molecular chaperone GrpE